ncbi:MAG: hypothetical protein JXK93_11085 [Sphaerochaetaceae bacterium]|nr:hypothetical protein [Sphaerochaetaceae bacterium]
MIRLTGKFPVSCMKGKGDAMRIALSCLATEYGVCEKNLSSARSAIQMAAEHGCDLIVFPEMAFTGYGPESIRCAQSVDVDTAISRAGREYSQAVLYGHVRPEGGHWYNCAILTDRSGTETTVYRKIHPFRYADEHTYIDMGSEPCLASLSGTQIGLSICYDVRFSELYRFLSLSAPVVINIAAWPEARDQHFQTLLRSRAIEFQIYSIAVNQSGFAVDGTRYGGVPYVYDPWGEPIVPEKIGTDLYSVSISPDTSYRVREAFPVSADVRMYLYTSWYGSHTSGEEGAEA